VRTISRLAARTALTAATAALALISALPAGAAGPACGDVVVADVRLTADLSDCAGFGLVVGASGVTIDLAGHTISGTGTSAGIATEGHDRVTLKGGTIRGFAQGVDLLAGRGARIRDVALVDNLIGIVTIRSTRVTLDRVVATGNAGSGVEAFLAEQLTVRDSAFSGNGRGGIVDRSTWGSRYTGNAVSGNAFGMALDDSDEALASGNRVEGNDGDGIALGFRTTTAEVDRNTASGNAGHGISVEEPGNRVKANTADGNARLGISAVAGTRDGGRNTASGNAGGSCVGVACA
jgi:parallel beta-helix repeat protein